MSFEKICSGALAAASLLLTGCDMGGGGADLRYPTVQEMDDFDVQHGLPPRKARGAPKRSYQYEKDVVSSDSSGTASPSPEPAAEPAAPAPAAPSPAAPPPEPPLDPSLLKKLR